MENYNELINHISEFVKIKWQDETSNDAIYRYAFDGDGQSNIDVMQKFIEMCEKGAYSPQNSDARDALHKVKAMLSRVLEVDLSTTANRKGKVPSALGITGKKVDIMWRIIMLTWDEVEDYLIRTNQRRMSNTGIASAICEGLSICEIWNEEQIPSEDTIRKHYANNLHKLI